ncbi:hypothetical protein C1Y40_04277 [Mycobacterium talmoniae]|uniref:Uncharacterized protein n=1 Tax=Mycobacterium talmoniae TaxID=1858794 RepID=A0A2S8BFW3_9MYCO|nr:hypothetical protein C1Y40_04277 [Mycobacterium talmoniae]
MRIREDTRDRFSSTLSRYRPGNRPRESTLKVPTPMMASARSAGSSGGCATPLLSSGPPATAV